MAIKELWYAESGPILYDDELTGWYSSPYDTLAVRAALISQAYVTDVPVHDLEVARRMDIDGTPGAILKAGSNGLPSDSSLSETDNYIASAKSIIPSDTLNKDLGSSSNIWRNSYTSEIRLSPKSSSSGPEGTIFFSSTDKAVYVGVES